VLPSLQPAATGKEAMTSHGGRPRELDSLLPELYGELKKLAIAALGSGRAQTLQPTALVHEAYLRLSNARRLEIGNRKQFYALAARVMRQVLVDHARAKGRRKRGGDALLVTLGDEVAAPGSPTIDLLALDEALARLEQLDPRQVEIVEMRYLAGLSVEEVAGALGVSPTTVKREAAMARAFLLQQLRAGGG